MVTKTLEQVDIDAGRQLIGRLLAGDPGREQRRVELRAAAWLHTERKEEWQLYLVTPLVDFVGAIEANFTVMETIRHDDELMRFLNHRVEVVGRHDPHAVWLRRLRPVGTHSRLADLEIESTPSDGGISAAHIYLSL